MSTQISMFEDAVVGLIREKPFFGHLLMTMRRVFTTKMPTAGVAVEPRGITLYVNLDFMSGMSHEGRMAVLEHECLHILHSHPVRAKKHKKVEGDASTPEGKEVSFNDHKIFNIAADCSINQYLKNFSEVKVKGESIGVTLEKLQEQVKDRILPWKESEYYFDRIKEDLKDKVQSDELDPMDSHEGWESGEMTDEQAQKKINKHLKTARDMSKNSPKGTGLTPQQEEVLAETLESKVDWRSQLRNFAANAEKTLVEATRKKRNKRYGIVYPGQKVEPQFKVGVCVDTSGSVSDLELSQFFSEIRKMSDNPNCEVHVVEADSVVTNVYKFEKHMEIRPKGRGGTAYQPAIDKCLEMGVDAIIYLGDGDTADSPKKPRVPFLWGMVRGNAPPAPWGRVIQIETKS